MPSPPPGVEHKPAGTIKGRSTKEQRLNKHRTTSYPKLDPNIKLCTDARLPRAEPRRKSRNDMPMTALDDRFFLQNEAGEYVHLSGTGWTRDKQCAYWGTKEQIKKLLKRGNDYGNVKRVPYRTVLGIGVAHGQGPSGTA